jgi:uncharacterized protein (DUF433 family)
MFKGAMTPKTKTPSRSSSDPRLLPAYSVAEAAHYLRMPQETLRSWVVGRLYPVSGRQKRSKPLVHLDDPKGQYLSFINLVEAHVLAAIRRRHGVRLPKVRIALDYVRRQFAIERPLIDEGFQTDGLDLFVERYGEMINASREGQQAMKEIITVYLQRMERDPKGMPIRFFPFTRQTESDGAPKSDPRVVMMTPAVSFGRPVIAGTGIPVSAIYERYRAGDSVADLTRDFRLETSAVEEAIRCEAA